MGPTLSLQVRKDFYLIVIITALGIFLHSDESLIFLKDPENEVYDRLSLNRGWNTMIRPATAFRFKDRIFGSGQSLDLLFEVLGKWKDGR